MLMYIINFSILKVGNIYIMKKNLYVKIFILVFSFIFYITPVFSNAASGTISRILISPLENNTYLLNVYFDNGYKGQPYIEKKGNGLYSIYLTNSELDLKKTKILYRNSADKRKIKISLDQKPLTNNGKLSNYVILDVGMNADYSLKFIPKDNSEDKFLFFALPLTNSLPLILAAIILLLLNRIVQITNKKNNSYTKFPDGFYINNLNYNKKFKYNKNTLNTYIKKNTVKKGITPLDKSSFKCFDLPVADNTTLSNSDFKKAIKKSYLQTNPLEQETLDIPYAEEVIDNENAIKKDKNGAEIISIINIDKNKGFYLANLDNNIGLFGYINHNIFPLKTFRDLTQINLQARFYDNSPEGEIYIVRIDSYKAMVEFSKDSIREIVVL